MKRLTVFSRHPSHDVLRKADLRFMERVVFRLGSQTTGRKKYPVQINQPESVAISANKLLMKQKFTEVGVKTAAWFVALPADSLNSILFDNEAGSCDESRFGIDKIQFPIVAKHIFGSRGTGNYLLKNVDELTNWLKGKTLSNYIFEKFFSGTREYRLHVNEMGCFYTCRKMLKNGCENRWYRNDSNSCWIREENPSFDKPVNWNAIVADCVKALAAIGLDVAAFDVRVQSAKDKKGNPRKEVDYIIIESNSAPSFGEITAQKYIEMLPSLIAKKMNL